MKNGKKILVVATVIFLCSCKQNFQTVETITPTIAVQPTEKQQQELGLTSTSIIASMPEPELSKVPEPTPTLAPVTALSPTLHPLEEPILTDRKSVV